MDAETVSTAGGAAASLLRVDPAPAAQPSRDPWEGWRRAIARTIALLLHLGLLALILIGLPKEERPTAPPPIPVEIVTLPPPKPEAPARPKPPPPMVHRESGGAPDRPAGKPPDAEAPPSPAPAPKPTPVTSPKTTPAPPQETKETAVAMPSPPLPPAPALEPAAPAKPPPPPRAPHRPPTESRYDSNLIGEGGGDRYLNALRDLVGHRIVFPPGAHGLRGEAIYMIRINRQGRLIWVSIVQSTGARILDKAGLDAIKSAAPFPPPPPDIPGNEVVLYYTVPMAP